MLFRSKSQKMGKIIDKIRETKETKIEARLNLDGEGKYSISTGVGFFDHMLESFSKHSGIDIDIECKGDLHVDFHHSVEDCGIVIGEMLREAIFPIKAIERYGNSSIVMDEACVECNIDVSNRAFLLFDLSLGGKIGDFDCELVEEFFRAVVFNAGLSCHFYKKHGSNMHHIVEAVFKSFAVSLKRALRVSGDSVPSTKGVL